MWGINDNYNNYVTAATFVLSSLSVQILQQGAVIHEKRGTEG